MFVEACNLFYRQFRLDRRRYLCHIAAAATAADAVAGAAECETQESEKCSEADVVVVF